MAEANANVASESEEQRGDSASAAERRAQRLRISWIGATAASYAIDTLFLVLFAVVGTIPMLVPAAYGAGALATCGGAYALLAGNRNLKFRDPGFILPQALAGVVLQLSVVALAPQVAFPYLANMFTVFAFAMIWLSVRASVLVWLAGVLATALLFHGVSGRLGIPAATPFESVLVWLYFALTLGRCVVLSVHANGMRSSLSKSRRSLKSSLQQIQELVRYDELTKVFNRRALRERLEQEKSRADRTGVGFSVAIFDLDHFKQVNDGYGHPVGDSVLKAFSERVRHAMREADVFGRYGGEEFMLILVATVPATVFHAAERIRLATTAKDWEAVAPGLVLTVSAGIASYRKGESIDQLIGRADIALYEAKRAGRNQVKGEATETRGLS